MGVLLLLAGMYCREWERGKKLAEMPVLLYPYSVGQGRVRIKGMKQEEDPQGALPCLAAGFHSKGFLPGARCYFIL